MRRATKVILGGTALTALLVAYAPGPAAASPPVTTGASGYSAAANSGTASMKATLQLSGSLGGLLSGVVGPVVQNALNPLVSALQATTNSLVASTLGSSSALTASTPSFQGTESYTGFPNDTWPAACVASDTTTPCYQAASTNVSSSLVNLGVPVLRGYTQQNKSGANPIYGRAQVTNPSVALPLVATVPGLPANGSLLTASAVNSYAACPSNATAPSVGISAANVQLLGGLIGVTLSGNSIGSVTVAGKSYALNSLPATAIAGVNLGTYGSALKITIPLTLQQLELGLGLSSSVISTLEANAVANDSLTLTVIVGPSSSVTSTSAKAWGLGISADLSGSLAFNIAGLVGATVSVPTGIGGGNLGNVLDARLAYTACKAGSAGATSTPAVPPALI
jgi:hypothetical protein